MEFSMRNAILFPALGIAVLAGTSLAQAQTVETVITRAPAPTVTVQNPVVVTPVVETVPLRTTETVRTVRSTTHPARRMARAPAPASRRAATETTTQTTIRENIVPAPVLPAGAAINQPTYTEVVEPPPAVAAVTYPAPLYDVVPAAAAPPAVVIAQPPLPAYSYVYQPDRILVIDANTGIAVQALPR
jgi:hypothetical protein